MIRSRTEYESDLRVMLFRKAWKERDNTMGWTPHDRAIGFLTCLEISTTAPIVGTRAFEVYVAREERKARTVLDRVRERRFKKQIKRRQVLAALLRCFQFYCKIKEGTVDRSASNADAESAASAGADSGGVLGGEEPATIAAGDVDARTVTLGPDAVP